MAARSTSTSILAMPSKSSSGVASRGANTGRDAIDTTKSKAHDPLTTQESRVSTGDNETSEGNAPIPSPATGFDSGAARNARNPQTAGQGIKAWKDAWKNIWMEVMAAQPSGSYESSCLSEADIERKGAWKSGKAKGPVKKA